ncbi:MAG: 50S ribosomal protein L30 [bacterium]|nr:50S ribosomal protein L30 [bacterium]
MATKKVDTSKKEEYNGPKLKITLTKSLNGRLDKQKKTCEALGLSKINQTVIKRDNEATRGMIFVVKHLVTVTEVK